MTPRFEKRILLAALAVGLGLRLAYARHAAAAAYLPTSSDGYETIALSLLDRGEYAMEPGRPTSLREPSYPMFIAATYAVAGRRPGVILFLQCLLSIATGLLLWMTGRRIFGAAPALGAFVVFMVHPQAIYYCGYFFRETWLCFWFGLLLHASMDWSSRSPQGDAASWLGGAAAAMLGLANSALLPACALAGAALFAAAPQAVRRRRFVYYSAPLIFAFGAWTARNYAVHGRFIAGSTHGGEEFLQALVVPPDDLGTPRQIEIVAATPAFAAAANLSEAGRNESLTAASFRWIAENPGLFAARAAAGVFKFWKPWPYRRPYQHSYTLLVVLSLLSDGWIIPLGFLGLWRFRARWREAAAFPAALIAMTAVYGAVHAVIRYRLPLMGGMILLATAVLFEREA